MNFFTTLLIAALAVNPDYLGIIVPPNIAPLNFDISENATVTLISSAGDKLVKHGCEIRFDADEWRAFLSRAKGGGYSVEIVSDAGERYGATNVVSDCAIDKCLTYRLIPPSYTLYNALSICERDLESFDERTLYSNRQISLDQCINCHTPCTNDPDHFLFHKRGHGGGTMISSPKYGLKRHQIKRSDGLPGSCAYPAWHPSGDFIVFSVNETKQSFYMTSPNKVEVADLQSDLAFYSLADDCKLTMIEREDKVFECFPTWSPDGNTLYTSRAIVNFDIVQTNEAMRSDNVFQRLAYRDADTIHYDIAARKFDAKTRTFSPPETIIDSTRMGMSFLFPRVSPDGKYLLVTVADAGGFPIWHPEADLAIYDLARHSLRFAREINSSHTESYHSFAHSGRWVVFSSRRDDGVFTRPYIAAFDPATGRFGKPFKLPVYSPTEHSRRFYSYNLPEFTTGHTRITPRQLRGK